MNRLFRSFASASLGPIGLLRDLLVGVVQISMRSVQATLTSGKLLHVADRLRSLAHTAASTAEELRASTQEIASRLSHVNRSMADARSQATATAELMRNVDVEMNKATTQIATLRKVSNDVRSFVDRVTEIANQTDLLSLNASIEAARAGSAGKSFAVVAAEVRKLAGRTREVTEQIAGSMENIVEVIRATQGILESAAKNVQEGANKVTQVERSICSVADVAEQIALATKEQANASTQVGKTAASVQKEAEDNQSLCTELGTTIDGLVNQIESQRSLLSEQAINHKVLFLAKADHFLWKKKLMDFEAGRCTLSPKDLGDHTTCRLGKWYYGEAGKPLAGYRAFVEMEDPHMAVHRAAREAVQLRQKDPQSPLEEQIKAVETASSKVVSCLDTLIAEVAG